MWKVALVVMLVACRSEEDACRKLLTNTGKEVTEASLKECSAHIAEVQRYPQMKCAIAAANKTEADKCFAEDMKKLQESSAKIDSLTAKIDAENAKRAAATAAEAPVQAELAELNKQFDEASDAAVKATSPEERAAYRDKMQALSLRMKELRAKLDQP